MTDNTNSSDSDPTPHSSEPEEIVKRIVSEVMETDYDTGGAPFPVYDKEDVIERAVVALNAWNSNEVKKSVEAYELVLSINNENRIGTFEWMIKHPNDSLINFMKYHVPSEYYKRRRAARIKDGYLDE